MGHYIPFFKEGPTTAHAQSALRVGRSLQGIDKLVGHNRQFIAKTYQPDHPFGRTYG